VLQRYLLVLYFPSASLSPCNH